MNEYSTYILLDTAMMADFELKPWIKGKRRARWILPIYERPAWEVSPGIIDIEAAYKSNRINMIVEMLNCVRPQLHASFIDTTMNMEDLAEHLRKFIGVDTEDGKELTLRIADCVVLPWLHQAMTPEQWAAFQEPIHRWGVHGRDGVVTVLPQSVAKPSPEPLRFSPAQISALEQAHEPDQLLFNLRAMRYGHKWAESLQQELKFATDTLRAWKTSKHTDTSTLLLFARGVFDTKGALLELPALRSILDQDDLALVRKDIQNMLAANSGGRP